MSKDNINSSEKLDRAFENFFQTNPEAINEIILEIDRDPQAIASEIESRFQRLMVEHMKSQGTEKQKIFDSIISKIRGKFDALSSNDVVGLLSASLTQESFIASFRDLKDLDDNMKRSLIEDTEIIKEIEKYFHNFE